MSPRQRRSVLRIVVSPVHPGQVVGGLRTSPDCLRDGSAGGTAGRMQLNGDAGLGCQVSLCGVHNHNRSCFGNCSRPSRCRVGRVHRARLGVSLDAFCRRDGRDPNLTITGAVLDCPCQGFGDGSILARPVKPGCSRMPTGSEHNERGRSDLHPDTSMQSRSRCTVD